MKSIYDLPTDICYFCGTELNKISIATLYCPCNQYEIWLDAYNGIYRIAISFFNIHLRIFPHAINKHFAKINHITINDQNEFDDLNLDFYNKDKLEEKLKMYLAFQ